MSLNCDNNITDNQIQGEQDEEEQQMDWMFGQEEETETHDYINHFKYTDKNIIIQLYNIMRIIDKICIKNDFTYWTAFGTTLGCIRHGGIIPWDDDLDIGIKIEDKQKFENIIKPQLIQNGIGVAKNYFGYKLYQLEGSQQIQPGQCNEEQYQYPFCDVFFMVNEDDKYIIQDKIARKDNENEYYSIQQIENLQRKQFGDFQVNVPGEIEKYLIQSYGNKWNSEAKTHYLDHVRGCIMQTETFQLTNKLLEPAQPFN